MKFAAGTALGIAVLLWTNAPASADMYKWVDGNGTVHFQDYPPEKASHAAKVGKIPVRKGAPDGGRPAAPGTSGSPSTPPGAKAAPKAVEYPKVEIFGTEWCPYCRKAREFFRSRGIPYLDYDVEKDEAARRRKNELDPDSGVPTTVIGRHVFHGYSESAYDRALRTRP